MYYLNTKSERGDSLQTLKIHECNMKFNGEHLDKILYDSRWRKVYHDFKGVGPFRHIRFKGQNFPVIYIPN